VTGSEKRDTGKRQQQPQIAVAGSDARPHRVGHVPPPDRCGGRCRGFDEPDRRTGLPLTSAAHRLSTRRRTGQCRCTRSLSRTLNLGPESESWSCHLPLESAPVSDSWFWRWFLPGPMKFWINRTL